MEKWKRIKDLEHEVSSNGRVRIGERIFKQFVSNAGYLRLGIKHVTYSVHRLVAEAFIPNPDNKRTVNHKNGNKLDNRVENLEWMTYSENKRHAYDSGLQKKPNHMRGRYGKLANNKVAVGQYDLNGKFITEFFSSTEAERKTGVSAKHIPSVCTGKRKTAGGYIWKHIKVDTNAD